MEVDADQSEYEELQSFLELEDEEMKEIEMSTSTQNRDVKEKIYIGRGNAANGHKKEYDTYPPSNAFNKVKYTS